MQYFLVIDEIIRHYHISTHYQEDFLCIINIIEDLFCPMNEIWYSSMPDRQNSLFFCNRPTEFTFFSDLDLQNSRFFCVCSEKFPSFIRVLSTNFEFFCSWSIKFANFSSSIDKICDFSEFDRLTLYFSVPIWQNLRFFSRLIGKIHDFFRALSNKICVFPRFIDKIHLFSVP